MRLALAALFSVAGLAAQDPFAAVRFLEGRWTGEASGKPGAGKCEREYRFELRGKFLVGKSRAVYAPAPDRTHPEVHEDWSILSFDSRTKRLMLRQFHVEGFVNEYAQAGDALEFTTFHIDNLPDGWRAREAYRVISRDQFVETFSIAAPGKDFEPYSETRLRRVTSTVPRLK